MLLLTDMQFYHFAKLSTSEHSYIITVNHPMASATSRTPNRQSIKNWLSMVHVHIRGGQKNANVKFELAY